MIELSGRSLDEAERELIRRWSEGLPLLVDELLTSVPSNSSDRGGGPWSVPASFAAAVESRLDSWMSLDAEPRPRLRFGCAAGLGSRPRIAELDGGQAVNSLRRAVRAELLIIDGPSSPGDMRSPGKRFGSVLLPPERSVLSRRAAQGPLDRGGLTRSKGGPAAGRGRGPDDGAALLLRIAERERPQGRCAAPNRFSIR